MNINESVKWDEGIYLIRRNDKVEGGRDGAANIQATQLANRTAYLKVLLEGNMDFKNLTFFRTEDDPDGTIAGNAATTGGQLYRVAQGLSSDAAFIYYLNNDGVAEAVAYSPSNAAVEKIKQTISDAPEVPRIAQWESEGGFVLAWLDNGALKTTDFEVGAKGLSMDILTFEENANSEHITQDEYGFILEKRSSGDIENISGKYVASQREEKTLEDEYGFIIERRTADAREDISGKYKTSRNNDVVIEDEYGFHIFSAMKAGAPTEPQDTGATRAAFIASMDNLALAGSSSIYNRLVTGIQRPVFDFNLIITYGQSLSTGTEGWPALSVLPVESENVLMFGDSVRPTTDRDTGGSKWVPMGGEKLQPLIAVTQTKGGSGILTAEEVANLAPGATNEGETFDVGAVNFWRKLQNDFRGVSVNPERKIVVLNCGVQGRTVEQLSKGNALNHYNRVIEAVTKVKACIANQYPAASVGITAILYAQGEWNYWVDGSGTHDRATFLELTKKLRTDLISDCAYGICGQSLPPAWVTYQTGAGYTVDTQDLAIGMAQIDMADTVPGCWMATPVYPVTDKNGHLDPNGYRWAGMQFGKVLHRILDRGMDWKPLKPIKAVRYSDKEIIVSFLTPSPPLQFKESYVVNISTQYPNKGFLVKDANGVVGIESVSIVGQSVVSVLLSSVPVGEVYLWYAPGTTYRGNGNLCDSDFTVAPYNYEYRAGSGQYASANIAALVNKPYPLNNFCVAFRIKCEDI